MDTTLKQRLIGAIVLIALAVIFLPMLVQGPAPDSGVADVSLRVPDAPAGEYETRELPLAGPAPSVPAPAAEPAVASAPEPSAAAAAEPAVAAGDWAVSFGAYSSEKDAQAVRARLTAAGLPGFIEPAEQNGRQVWRVRVGPYPDRALAEAGRLQAIRIRDDVRAQVIALNAAAAAAPAASTAATPASASQAQPATTAAGVRSEPLPADPAPARSVTTTSSTAVPAKAAATPSPAVASTAPARSEPRPAAAPAPAAPAATSVGFAVQMGAFSREADALALRDKLRAAGFSALVQPVRTDKGTLNRVRVGPVVSREEAVQLKARLARFGEGNVVSHP